MRHIHLLKEREKRWSVNLVDDAHQQQFMKTLFANTSTYWAYQQINPRLGVAKSDIWRYAQLLLYGGGYLDEDSTLEGSLDVLVKADDAIILTKESNTFSDECFKDDFHASDSGLARRFGLNRSHAVIERKVVANWAFFVEPKHPVFRRALENIVQLVKREHECRSLLKLAHYSHRWKVVMCVTGPTLLTVSVKEVLLESPNLSNFRLERRDFVDWGGRFKVDGPEAPKKELHYMLRMQRAMLTLLTTYIPSPLRELEMFGVDRDWEKEKEKERESNETAKEAAPLQLFTVFQGQVRPFKDENHARIFGYVTRKATPMDPAFFSTLPKGPDAPTGFLDSDLGKARLLELEGKIVCTVSQHHQRAYFVVANGSSHSFLSWDHLTAAMSAQNRTHDEAEVLDEEFVKSALLLPIGGFYGQEHLGNDELVSTSSGALYVLRNHTRTYCSFRDWDSFTSSRFAPSFRKALRVHDQRINSTLHAGECVD